MMKNKMRLIAALALVFCLMSSVMAVSASADFTQTYEVGQVIGKTEVYVANTKILSSNPNSGSLPGGVLLSNDDYRFYISGSPQSAGSYECSYWVQTEEGWASFILKLTVVAPATPTPIVTVAPTSAPTPTPTATANPTAAPKITKHPTGETVEAGGTAKFIARADNATELVWRIVSADTTNTVLASEASSYFSGLTVAGLGTDTLTLSNIPKSINGWSIECKFIGPGGASFSNGATLRVNSAGTTNNNNNTNTNSNTNTNNNNTTGTSKTANITTQPKGVEVELGKSTTLTIAASAGDGGKLSYQWYSSTTDSRANIVSISGATSSSYTPPQTEGTVYYCASVISTLNGSQSTPVYSELVPVRYAAATATPSPSPTDSASPSPAASAAASVQPTDNDSAGGNRYSFSASLIFFGITGVVAIIAMVVIIIYIKKSGNDDDEGE